MKKVICIAAILFFLVPLVCFSQDSSKRDTPMAEKGMKAHKAMMMGGDMKERMGGEFPKMGMMGMMMPKSMIATLDGGAIVLMGNKLLKYDKDLNLIKEVELKVDSEGMRKMMEKCPHSQEAMQEKPLKAEEGQGLKKN